MIKVINNKNNEKIYHQHCDGCGVDLEYLEKDAYEGALGAKYIRCPNCNKELILDELDSTPLNSDNIKFPKHFFYPSGVYIEDEQIQRWVRECLKIAEESDEPFGYFVRTGSGNTEVILLAYADEYEIIVTKDYFHTSIDRDYLD